MMDCRAEEIVVRHLTLHHMDEIERGGWDGIDAAKVAQAVRLPEEQVVRVLDGLEGRIWPYRPVSMDVCYARVHPQVAGGG